MNLIFNILFIFTIVGGGCLGIYEILKPSIERKIKFKVTIKRIRKIVQVITIILLISTVFTKAIIYLKDVKKEKETTLFKKILVDPPEIIVPSDVTLPRVPIVITNNYAFPVYPLFEIKVKGGPIDLTRDFIIMPWGSGVLWQPRLFTCQLPGIAAGSSLTLYTTIDASRHKHESYLSLSIDSFTKNPFPTFFMDSMSYLPEKIEMPQGFIPKRFKNGEKEANIK
jgi:hypothetical protein